MLGSARGRETVLVIAGGSSRRQSLAVAIELYGYRAIPVATPLDAIAQLIAPASTIRAALVAEDLPTARGEQVLRSLATELPAIGWVLLVETAAGYRVSGLPVCSWQIDDVGAALRWLGLSWPAAG